MAQSFTHINRARKEDDTVDLRKTINNKQIKTLNKHRKAVYDLVNYTDDDDDGYYQDDDYRG